MPRTEVIRVIPKFHVDLSDLVEMESSGKFQDEKLDQPVMKKTGTTSEKPKDDKNIIINSHPDVSEDYLEWVKVLYSPDWADLLKNQLQSEHTPFALCVEILDKVKIVQNKKVLVISAIEFIAVLIDKLGIKKENIFFLDEGQKDATMNSVKREVIIEADMIPEQNILNMNEVKKMKFDFVVGNPPYNGKAALHQKFFNLGFSLLVDGGVIAFIQPATMYFNKKENVRKAPEKEMLGIVSATETEIIIKNENVFTSAEVATKLAITLSKKGIKGPVSITYENGFEQRNLKGVAGVNQLQIPADKFLSMLNKVKNYCQQVGTFQNVVWEESNKKAKLPKIRGHVGGNPDFFTLVPRKCNRIEETFNVGSHDFGIPLVSNDHLDNFYDYCELFFVRFCLALLKFNTNSHMGEMALIPMADFSHRHTDEEMFRNVGFTKEEIEWVYKVIPVYY